MKISELLSESLINFDLKGFTKDDVLDEMIEMVYHSGKIKNRLEFKEDILDRERVSSTGIGEGIAIPHTKSNNIIVPGIAIGISKKGVNYESFDDKLVKIIFMIFTPDSNTHLDLISKLSSFLMDNNFVNNIMDANNFNEVVDIINTKENNTKEILIKDNLKVLAVTACPTGIAHTYMAEESLYKSAQKLGINIKVETNGSSGVKNKLTHDEIEKCDVIVIAADKNVEMARFNGKKVIVVDTKTAIRNSDELLKKAIDGKQPIYYEKKEYSNEINEYKENKFRQIYKSLMNGVSHMLPFVIGGGILIAIAFLIDAKNAGSPNFGSVNVVAKLFKTIGEYSFNFMLPILSAYIASSIADRPGLAVGFVGGYMATIPNASFISTISDTSAGFLGALVAGFVSGYIILFIKKITNKIPKSFDGLKPTLIYPVLGILLIGIIMYFIINAPFAFINNIITNFLNSLNNTSIVLLGVILAGMMSIDMGGPINKAAYVFGTAAITSGNYSVMAPVMIGGMVPPLVIALSSTIFPNKFTKKERTDGKVNYIMGASFITEGVIPFAASDPWRVILSCVIGSSIAGGLCAAFGCELMAPHGGIFVLAVIKNPLLYLLSLIIGTVVGSIVLGILKKDITNQEFNMLKE